jgi:ADP-ribosylglycohydrolase
VSGYVDQQRDRAAGALWGLAVGDALGMPTQLLSRQQIRDRFGDLDDFVAGAADHLIAAGLPAGTVTDDTEQTVLLARSLEPGAHLDQQRWAATLSHWEQQAAARGSLDLLGPSTRAALAALRDGVGPDESGRHGTTNGAAMRICPVGIAVDSTDLPRLVDRVVEASRLTHNTSVALSGAAAVAAAVSRCVDGAELAESVGFAVRAADLASRRGPRVAGASVARRVEWVVQQVATVSESAVADLVIDLVGTSLATQESVPAAFAIAVAYADDPWQALRTAAGLGGDTDTIAAMVGAILGAAKGRNALPALAIRRIREINHLDLDAVADDLLRIRWS